MKLTGVRSLQTKMWRIADDLHDHARRLERDGDNKMAVEVELIALSCRRLAEKIGNGNEG